MEKFISLIILFLILIVILIILYTNKHKEKYEPSSTCKTGDFLVSKLTGFIDNNLGQIIFTLNNTIDNTDFCINNLDPTALNDSSCLKNNLTSEKDSITVSNFSSFPDSDFNNNDQFYLVVSNFCNGDTYYPQSYKLKFDYNDMIGQNSDPNNPIYQQSINVSYILDKTRENRISTVTFSKNLFSFVKNAFTCFYNISAGDSYIQFYITKNPQNFLSCNS